MGIQKALEISEVQEVERIKERKIRERQLKKVKLYDEGLIAQK